MQKATLFTLILAVLVSLSIADFLVGEPIKASVIPVVEKQVKKIEPDIQNTIDQSPKTTIPESTIPATNEVAQFLDKRQFKLDSLTDGKLAAVGFKGMKVQKANFDKMIFQLLDVSTYLNLSAVRYHLTDSRNIFGIMQEFEFQTEAEAVTMYADLKQKIGAFSPRVTSNQTNQYGDQSFFMNDTSRTGTAFLVFRLQNNLFTFSYPKASHDFFKTLLLSLAK